MSGSSSTTRRCASRAGAAVLVCVACTILLKAGFCKASASIDGSAMPDKNLCSRPKSQLGGAGDSSTGFRSYALAGRDESRRAADDIDDRAGAQVRVICELLRAAVLSPRSAAVAFGPRRCKRDSIGLPGLQLLGDPHPCPLAALGSKVVFDIVGRRGAAVGSDDESFGHRRNVVRKVGVYRRAVVDPEAHRRCSTCSKNPGRARAWLVEERGDGIHTVA